MRFLTRQPLLPLTNHDPRRLTAMWATVSLTLVTLAAADDHLDRGMTLLRNGSTTQSRDLQSDTWVAVDGLDRRLPEHHECGGPRPDRFVAIFYFLWHGAHGTSGPHDITQILSTNTQDRPWGAPGAFHHWGQPELGYYVADDPYVFQRHASMLTDAGVDVVVMDVTNGPTYDRQAEQLMRTWLDMRRLGMPTPQIAFLAHSHEQQVVTHLYQTLYAREEFRPCWFLWQGKPLMMANPEGLSDEIQQFFTFRESWAWSKTAWFGDGRDKWAWIDNTPQAFGWHEEGKPEQMPVAVGGHPVTNIGRSHRHGVQPIEPGSATDQGIYFQEQWDHALQVDPSVIFVTGWNEWVAQRFVKGENDGPDRFLGKRLHAGETYFVDQYTREYSRDIEPMAGGHTDNYYYQLVANIRRFKGVRPSPTADAAHSIIIDGEMDDWSKVSTTYFDTVGDTAHRDHPGWGSTGPLVNRTGRNDLESFRVAHDDQRVYFLASAVDSLTTPDGKNWMLLYVNVDGNHHTGWLGYDYVINRRRELVTGSIWHSSIESLSADGQLGEVGTAELAVVQRQLEVSLPRRLFRRAEDNLDFEFHWADNVQHVCDVTEFFQNGDSAPNRRFNYRYRASAGTR